MSQQTFETYERPTRPRPESATGGCFSSGAAVDRFVAVSAVCVGIWLMTGAGYFWPMWVMLGTGLPALLELLGRRRRA